MPLKRNLFTFQFFKHFKVKPFVTFYYFIICSLLFLPVKVGGYEIHCHRVVVGGASRAIYDELCLGEQESGPVARIPIDASKPGLLPNAVEVLVDYMYTSRFVLKN